MSIIKAPCGLNLDSDTFEVEGQVVKGKGSIPPATADTLGGVKIGDGIDVTEDGTISVEGGGSDDFVITATVDSAALEPTVTFDKSWNEIVAAINSDKFIKGKVCYGDSVHNVQPTIDFSDGEPIGLQFLVIPAFIADDTGHSVTQFYFYNAYIDADGSYFHEALASFA